MRIWDLNPGILCRNHLLGEHQELHAVWVIITRNRKGYSRHPEVLRWRGKLKALYLRHDALVKEFRKRGYKHHSCLDKRLAAGISRQNVFVDSPQKQKVILRLKKCACKVKP